MQNQVAFLFDLVLGHMNFGNTNLWLSTTVTALMCIAKWSTPFRFSLSGEFTLRAFLNGRLDLSQAENVEKLISSKSTAAADAALAGIQVSAL